MRTVTSLTCYDTTVTNEQRVESQLENNESRVWNLRHRVGWINNPSPGRPFIFSSSFPSIASFLHQSASNSLGSSSSSSLSDDNFREFLRSSTPKTYDLIVFFHAISVTQSSLSSTQLDPMLFRSILTSLRLDLFPQLVHEMVQSSLFSLASVSHHEEYFQLLEWLCTSPNAGKRKSGDTPSKSSKRVRCEVSPSRVSAGEDESHLLTTTATATTDFVTPKKHVFGSPNKMVPPHPSSFPKYHSPSSAKSEMKNGIAFPSPGKEDNFRRLEANGPNAGISSPLASLKEFFMTSLSMNSVSPNVKNLQLLSQSVSPRGLIWSRLHFLLGVCGRICSSPFVNLPRQIPWSVISRRFSLLRARS
jgi:hypothetical protein